MKKIIRLLRGFTRHMTKSNVNAHASCAAYFMFLSLIPIIILLCSLLPYTSLEKSDLLRGVAQVMPMPLVPMMSGLIDSLYNSTVGVTSVAAVVTVWSCLLYTSGIRGFPEQSDARGTITGAAEPEKLPKILNGNSVRNSCCFFRRDWI